MLHASAQPIDARAHAHVQLVLIRAIFMIKHGHKAHQ